MNSKLFRCLLHIPVGLGTVLFGYVHWVYALCLLIAFLAYEITEDWRIKDHAYIDIYGYMWGLALGVIGLLIYKEVYYAITT